MSTSSCIFSIIGVKYWAIILPSEVIKTSIDDFNFSIEPPKPDIMASAISRVVLSVSDNAALSSCTSAGAVFMTASHDAIWFLPKIAPAAAICSFSDSFANERFKFSCMTVISFIEPSSFQMSDIAMPYCSIASRACFVGCASLAIPVFNEFAATFASIPLFAITPSIKAASSTLLPAVLNMGAATDMLSDNELTSSAELLQAVANTSA